MKIFYTTLLTSFLFFSFSPTINAQKSKDDEEPKTETDEKQKKEKSDSKIKPYEDIITESAISEEGLFNVHKVGSKFYFEIPDTLLEKEILVVSRISGFVKNLNFGGAGMKSRPQQVIRWQRKDEQILLRSVSYNSIADEDLPIYKSLKNNNFEPIIMVFDISAIGKDSNSVVFNVDPLFTTEVDMIGPLSTSEKKNFEIGGIDSKRSMINYMKAFPQNVEVRHIMTYKGKKLPDNSLTQSLSMEMNQSFILLPAVPMQSRFYDSRVSYFSLEQTDYGLDEQKAATKRLITRWRLEPKDMEAFNRGELVEPKKPIVYYLDPGTPEEWRPFLKKGIEDWQVAFEAAGFKNAIIAKDAPSPEEDPDWSPEDVRYSVIRYITTDIQNAQGPHVHDPRTGEILESDILWYHNVMNLLRNWYFVQTAAVNPEARGVKFEKEVMGELIRFVAAHEVGHTLGLPHNMGSSPGYPVDSLRSPTFTATHGTAPSIMDYARFNYVAQPEDGVTSFYPGIGEYDLWSIEFGYKPIPQANSAEEELPILNSWIKAKAGNPIYRFGSQQRGTVDPSAQTEDLGDDAVKASDLGIKNLQRIIPNLITWTEKEGKNYDDLRELYGQVLGQFGRYAGHVSNNIGGIYNYQKTYDQEGVIYSPVPKSRQKDAIDFLNRQLFATPDWMIDNNILQRIESNGFMDRLRNLQVRSLNNLFAGDRLNRLVEIETLYGSGNYTIVDLFNDTKKGIWSELKSGAKIDPFRRNLQRAYINKMDELMKLKDAKYDQSDIKAMARGTLESIKKQIKSAVKKQKDQVTKYHLKDTLARIDEILGEED
jgi:uncharacterized protein DUF4953/uncharacterized protein DUF5117/uncharacterized protein DUF5118